MFLSISAVCCIDLIHSVAIFRLLPLMNVASYCSFLFVLEVGVPKALIGLLYLQLTSWNEKTDLFVLQNKSEIWAVM